MKCKNVSEPAGEQMDLFSLAGSLSYASHTALPANAGEKTMSGTSGRKCLEQFEKFNRNGSWAKTFSALLIGTGDWFSTRCKLTWKLKGTKYNRMYFQLAPSTHRTGETGFGLLPTPNTMDTLPPKEGEAMERIANGARKGRTAPSNLREYVNPKSWDAYQLLPTPRANKVNGCDLNSENLANRNKGNLEETVAKWVTGMLPTPMSQDGQNSTAPASQAGRDTLPGMVAAGKISQQLNPQFVLEMMGFPPDWTKLPFLNGETKVSRQPETR